MTGGAFRLWVLLVAGICGSCASKPRDESGGNWISVPKLVFSSVRFRRPPSAAADPKADSGGIDYRSATPPGEKLDCRLAPELFSDLALLKLGPCLKSVSEQKEAPPSVTYRVRLDPRPYLELVDPLKAPSCLRGDFARIPLPREAIFLVPDPENPSRAGSSAYACHVARVPIGDDVIRPLGVRWPLWKRVVRVDFPFSKPPADEAQARSLLVAWALAAFPRDSDGILTRLLPWDLCRRCLGDDAMPGPGSPPLPLWPESPESFNLGVWFGWVSASSSSAVF